MSTDERAAFTLWLGAAEANRIAFKHLEDALSATDAVAQAILSEKYEDELYAEAQKPIAWRMPAIAASIAFLSLTLSATIFFNYQPHPHSQIYATTIGETRSVSLDDGSTVKMNTNTALAVVYERHRRTVSFDQGEAIFDVEHNTAKPFVVELPTVEIIVTGTSFNVQTLKNDTEIYVVSGTVQVRPISGQSVFLHEGDSIHIDSTGDAGAIAPFNPIEVLAWRYGKLRFSETPLQEVVDELNRYFRKKIILDDATLSFLPVTGEFDTADQTAAVEAITMIFDLKNEFENDKIVLSEQDR